MTTPVTYDEYAPVIAKRILDHCDHKGYKFTWRNWRQHHDKVPLEQMACMMLDELHAANVEAISSRDDAHNSDVTTRIELQKAEERIKELEGQVAYWQASCDAKRSIIEDLEEKHEIRGALVIKLDTQLTTAKMRIKALEQPHD
jgi:hypothetical protein